MRRSTSWNSEVEGYTVTWKTGSASIHIKFAVNPGPPTWEDQKPFKVGDPGGPKPRTPKVMQSRVQPEVTYQMVKAQKSACNMDISVAI
ncbi:hypothetical protein SUGI_0612340 [Cryptomeria japonica]|nr:hypothetical protein SUGI_0612340 [Cryptomeria japonica]